MLKTFVKTIGVAFFATGGYVTSLAFRENKPAIVFDFNGTLIQTYDRRDYGPLRNAYPYRDPDYEFFCDDPEYNPPYKKNDSTIDITHAVFARPGLNLTLHFLGLFNDVHLFTRGTYLYTHDILIGLNIKKHFINILTCREYKNIVGNDNILTQSKIVNKDLDMITQKTDRILVSDSIYDRHGEQPFYHIPEYAPQAIIDIELLKVCGFAVWNCLKKDIVCVKNLFNK